MSYGLLCQCTLNNTFSHIQMHNVLYPLKRTVCRTKIVLSDCTRKGHGGEAFSGSRKGESSNRSNGYLESVNPVLANISDVYALESVVAHIELGYSGTCDCIATYRSIMIL